MVKATLRAAARRIGVKKPTSEQIKRRTRALQADLLQASGLEDFTAPRFDEEPSDFETYLWRGKLIEGVKRAAAHHARSQQAVTFAIDGAEKALDGPLYSVVDKLWAPPSGDKHDYFSGPAYWWPTPDAAQGIPWTFRDGHMNPVRFGEEFDLTRLDRFAYALKMLALGWRFSGRDAFAEKAALLVRTWFIDPATAMRPHLAFAQIVPGRDAVTGTGIIETLRFVTVIDSLGLLADSRAFAAGEIDAVREWMHHYLRWMRESANGRLEQATNNNHGLSYDIQLLVYALFSRDESLAHAVGGSLAKRRIFNQIRGDGSLPEEMRRKESFFYVTYGVGFMFDVATVSEKIGINLWRYRSRDGSGIETALRAIEPYALDRKPWPHGGSRIPAPELYAIALRGARAYRDPGLAALAQRYAEDLPLQPIDLIVPPIETLD